METQMSKLYFFAVVLFSVLHVGTSQANAQSCGGGSQGGGCGRPKKSVTVPVAVLTPTHLHAVKELNSSGANKMVLRTQSLVGCRRRGE